MNLKRPELLIQAQEVIDKFSGPNRYVEVYFKWTCNACGARVSFEDPNVLYEYGDCCECGHKQEVTEGGFRLEIHSTQPAAPPGPAKPPTHTC